MTRDIPGRRRGPSGGDILFLGSFAHLPNVDAVVWFASEVFPLVRCSATSACISGQDPPPEVALGVSADTSCRHPIVVHGHRPDPMPAGWLPAERRALARWGAGIKRQGGDEPRGRAALRRHQRGGRGRRAGRGPGNPGATRLRKSPRPSPGSYGRCPLAADSEAGSRRPSVSSHSPQIEEWRLFLDIGPAPASTLSQRLTLRRH
jgi:hypothetical protein